MILLALCWDILAVVCGGAQVEGPVTWVAEAGEIHAAGEAPPLVEIGRGVSPAGVSVCTPIEPCEPAQGEVCAWKVTLYDLAGNPDAPCPPDGLTAWLRLRVRKDSDVGVFSNDGCTVLAYGDPAPTRRIFITGGKKKLAPKPLQFSLEHMLAEAI